MRNLFATIIIALILWSCGNQSTNSTNGYIESEIEFVKNASIAHNTAEFYQKEAVSFDLHLDFGGKPRIYGKLTLLTNSSKGIIEMEDGNSIIYNNGKVFHSPGLAKPEKARFDAYTWSYFFLFPYKMGDQGTVWNDFATKEMNGKTYNVNKLTFESNIGDAPDDWYVVYTDKQTNLVETAAYIVTFSKSQTEAEQNPHAIKYTNYTEIENIPIATEWTFYDWSEEIGLSGNVGYGTLSNIKFITPDSSLFEPGENFIEV